ncbi:hypothetical protein LWP59_36145 [Amycolatopsis acidiphila]|uniref:Uncharacterized protein n=1 Tax=Amycolatopsis acidiphila TaxID=715473 RepID=A0A558ABA7_9PSEU|nr:hypothetical protein [Amycolatopsis acidiphila]TVT21552.1 hypothetical protein FNH06_16425 [Amycolatopsis acidiphila]UIJ59415.1 hypothetical protein LWP59_36145 [Amycolatopsis acidiphila]GHG97098.1 hypothetical protein GCM10017788_76470 [Amycolatopsis acidiphila]
MTAPTRATPGLAAGSLIAIVFGLVFVEVNSGGLDTPWPLVVRIAGVLVAAGLGFAVFRLGRPQDSGDAQGTWFGERRYWIVVAAEAVALFGGLFVINGVLGHSEVAVAWIALVVGVHFFGLAAAFRLNRFHVLGAVMTLLGIAGFVLDVAGASAATIGLVSGVLSGVALFATVAVSLRL